MSSSDRPLHAVSSRPTSYSLDSVLPIDGFDSIAAGTNLLIEGPPHSDKREIALSLLANGTAQGENALVVSPTMSATKVSKKLTARGSDESNLYVVDCTGASGKGSFDDESQVKYVSSPGDLTGIGMGIVKCTQEIGTGAATGVRLGVLSVSTLARYAEVSRVFNLLHVITGRVSAAGYFGIYTLDPSTLDESDVNVLRSLFDGSIKIRETEAGDTEAKVVGIDGVDSSWTRI